MLRIEDTDTARNRPEWVEGILSALSAIGINAGDPAFEGPYFQSANAELHRAAAARLFTEGRAYYCDCTREDVVARVPARRRPAKDTAASGGWPTSRAGRCSSAPPMTGRPWSPTGSGG